MLEPENPNPRAVAGNNMPPSPIETLCELQRDAQTPERRERVRYVTQRANAKTVEDRETAGQAADIIKVATEVETLIETDRVNLTRPYREAADRAKNICDEFLEPLREARANLKQRLDAWNDAEDRRIEEQRAEQEAFFNGQIDPAKEKAADAAIEGAGLSSPRKAIDYSQPAEEKPFTRGVAQPAPSSHMKPPAMREPKKRKITGDLGATASRTTTKEYRVVDVRAVPDFILQSDTVKEAIVQVAKSVGKHMGSIDGIEITEKRGTQVR